MLPDCLNPSPSSEMKARLSVFSDHLLLRCGYAASSLGRREIIPAVGPSSHKMPRSSGADKTQSGQRSDVVSFMAFRLRCLPQVSHLPGISNHVSCQYPPTSCGQFGLGRSLGLPMIASFEGPIHAMHKMGCVLACNTGKPDSNKELWLRCGSAEA